MLRAPSSPVPAAGRDPALDFSPAQKRRLRAAAVTQHLWRRTRWQDMLEEEFDTMEEPISEEKPAFTEEAIAAEAFATAPGLLPIDVRASVDAAVQAVPD